MGYNLRPTECQARMGQVQLPKLAGFVNQRRKNVEYYRSKLTKYSDIFDFQEETTDSYSSWFGFAIILKDKCPFNVKEIAAFLKSRNIENRPVIAGNIANHPVMKNYKHRVAGSTDISDNIMRNAFALGCHQHLGEEAIDYVIKNIEEFINSAYGSQSTKLAQN